MVVPLKPNEREIAYCFLIARDGRKCNCCKKTLQELEELDEVEDRKRPLLLVECIDNSGDHTNYSNLQLACYSCNKRKDLPGPGTSQGYGPKVSREKQDALRFEPTYHRNLQIKLLDEEEICRAELRIAGKSLSGGANEVTTERYFGSEICTKVNPKGKYQIFPYECGSDFCNGTHVCLVGAKPSKLLVVEKDRLETSWNSEYGPDKKKFNNQNWNSWMPLEEYIETHALLLHHSFL